MMRARRGFALTAFSVNRYCDPPRRNEALLILKAPLEVFGITQMPTRLKLVSVRLTVMT